MLFLMWALVRRGNGENYQISAWEDISTFLTVSIMILVSLMWAQEYNNIPLEYVY